MNCNAGPDASNPSNTYQEGCLEGTKIFMQRHAAILGGAGIVVACLMVRPDPKFNTNHAN